MNAKDNSRNVKNPYLMGRRLKCAKCNYAFVGRTRREHNHYYYCKGREQKPECLCSMPSFRADLVDDTVWNWLKGLIEEPSKLTEGYRNRQAEMVSANARITEQIAAIDQQLEDLKNQQNKLLDLFLNGDFPKPMIDERKHKLDVASRKLLDERIELNSQLNLTEMDDVQFAEIEDYCAEIRERLPDASFESKRHVIEMFDVRGKLTIENDQKFVEVSCLITPQPVSLALISPSSSTGAIATLPCAYLRIPPSP